LAIGGHPFLVVFTLQYDRPGPVHAAYDHSVRLLRRILAAFALLIALATYVWIAAVRAVPRVRQRKAAARAARRAG
jgi:hypothetical protein